MKNIGLGISFFREKKFPGRGGQSRSAEAANVSQAVWSRYEHAERLYNSTLKKIAKTLDVSVAEIIEKSKELSAEKEKVSTGMTGDVSQDKMVDAIHSSRDAAIPLSPVDHNKPIWKAIADRFFYRLQDVSNVDLAERYNVTPGKILAWKKGDKPIPDAVINDMCRRMGISKRWVLCGELPWAHSVIQEYGNKLLQLQQEKYPGNDGKSVLLLKLGISNKQWRDLTTGNISGGIPSKTEQAKLADVFEVEPIELFGDNISPELIPDDMYPTREETEAAKNWIHRNPDNVNPLLLEYIREIVAVQGLCNLLVSNLLGEQSAGMLEQLAGLKQQLSAFQEALGNVLVQTKTQDLRNA